MTGKKVKRSPRAKIPIGVKVRRNAFTVAIWVFVLLGACGHTVGGHRACRTDFLLRTRHARHGRLWSVSRSRKCAFMPATTRLCPNAGAIPGAPLRYADLPPDLVQAVIAIEDRRFFSHYGLTRAGWRAPCSPICGPDALCRAGRR